MKIKIDVKEEIKALVTPIVAVPIATAYGLVCLGGIAINNISKKINEEVKR